LSNKQMQPPDQVELQRVLGSETFRHSDSLRRLLEYLGEKTLAGSAGGLKEYTIGIEAFHKPADYDPQQDTTVRVLAGKLRHKLDEYYVKEGAEDSIRIEFPKGHYELKFQPRAKDATSLHGPLRASLRRWRWISLGLSLCTLSLALVLVYTQVGSRPGSTGSSLRQAGWTPELELIWQPFLESDHPLVVSLGTPMFAKLSSSFFRNPRINEWQDALDSGQLELLGKDLKSQFAVPAYTYTGVGEATGAFLLCRLLYPRKPSLSIERNNSLSWDELRSSDVIFLGAPKLNQQLKDIPVKGGFVIEGAALLNQKPGPGEPETYTNKWSDDHAELLEDHALIYHLPGLHEHGQIMVLGSPSTEGTWAAVEYVTQPAYAKELVQKLRLPTGRLPDCYQVVVHAQFKKQVPWKMSYVSHRVLENPWK
jgi:hypothetical protein